MRRANATDICIDRNGVVDHALHIRVKSVTLSYTRLSNSRMVVAASNSLPSRLDLVW